jgi:hypothetical protein
MKIALTKHNAGLLAEKVNSSDRLGTITSAFA